MAPLDLRSELPPALRVARGLVLLQAGLLALAGLFLAILGAILSGSSVTYAGASVSGAAAIALGALYVALGAALVWLCVALGRRQRWARAAAVAGEALLIVFFCVRGDVSFSFALNLALCVAVAALVLGAGPAVESAPGAARREATPRR